MKMLTGSRLWFCNIILEAACVRVFPAVNERSALKNSYQSHRREFWGGFQQAFSKLVSHFKEANKQLYRVVKSFWKTLKIISANTESTGKIFRPYKKYPSLDTVTLTWQSNVRVSKIRWFTSTIFDLCSVSVHFQNNLIVRAGREVPNILHIDRHCNNNTIYLTFARVSSLWGGKKHDDRKTGKRLGK